MEGELLELLLRWWMLATLSWWMFTMFCHVNNCMSLNLSISINSHCTCLIRLDYNIWCSPLHI
ncbi:Trigger factor-like protein TIG Chloroplastic [Zea mays]|uniref:Trigger factor-like protein TIG Chloroplastic n=1 Tax=Zea mays TaxID=4577 RepID=A0A1D6IRG5_MAIZE|nr:Trigger factor-like protein TIG Chloroplastic [Zea mays]AQK38860.1 Trigger factor-like protein TIG Chloroplastic [Zea mays]